MCFNLFKRRRTIQTEYVFWDTNCYRLLGRIANAKGTVWLDNFLRKLKKAEHERKIKVKVSYIVLAEMLAHLDEDIASNNYLECKHGLFSALYHSDYEVQNLLHNADNEFIEFITGKAPIADVYRETSLYTLLLEFHKRQFNDDLLKANAQAVYATKKYLQNVKDDWKNSFINYLIKKHDQNYTGNWQIFMNNKQKRKVLLTELRKAKKSNQILIDFGQGMYEYVRNNLTNTTMPNLTVELLNAIIVRFKPLFDLQYRIFEFMCQSGYNLDINQNDITDYLIVGSLETGKSIFVSNEKRNLVPNLHSQGYKNCVWTFDQYCKELSISYD